MSSSEPLLRVVGITKQFPGVLALDHVSIEVRPGEVHALVGANGAGKSTLIKIIAGALRQDSGDIFVNGRRVDITDPHRAMQLGISAIFQDPCLVPHLSVEDNVLLGQEPHGRLPFIVDKGKLREKARSLLSELGLNIDLSRKVRELGRSHQQLVAIAKALSLDARLIIMDEPSSALTMEELEYLFGVIRSLRARGISVVYVSHRLEEIFAIADSVSVLRDGRYIGTRPVAAINQAELVRMIAGRDVEVDIHPRHPPSEEVSLCVRQIRREGAFSDITFVAHRGEVVAITGLVGSGRTEVARAIFGADSLDGGEINVQGRQLLSVSPQKAIRAGIFMLPEDRKGQGLIPYMTVKANITLPSLLHYSRWGLVEESKEDECVKRYVDRLRIRPPDPQRKVIYLSGGNQQKVMLAKALETGSQILIFDEPTAGIDVEAKAEIRTLISELANRGHTVLLISSEIEEVLALADRILVMHRGRLVGELNRENATAERILKLAMGGQE